MICNSRSLIWSNIYIKESCYDVCGVPWRCLGEPKVSLISAVNFYYVVNKFIFVDT
jgi:hypothetical protein